MPPHQLHIRKGFTHVSCSKCWNCVIYTARPFPFGMQTLTHCCWEQSEAWSSAALEAHLGLDIWSGMQFLFVHLWASHIRTCKAPKHLSGYQMYSLFYRFVASGRNYNLWFIPGFQISFFYHFNQKIIHSTHGLLSAWKKIRNNPYSTHCSGVMSLS